MFHLAAQQLVGSTENLPAVIGVLLFSFMTAFGTAIKTKVDNQASQRNLIN